MDNIEGNKIIAEFVGWKPVYSENVLMGYTDETDKMILLGEYKPHEDWNELMEVCDKIHLCGEWDVCITTGGGCSIFGEHEQPPYISKSCDTIIEAVWQAVVQFIQWYNTTNPIKQGI